jgi:phytoene synthase
MVAQPSEAKGAVHMTLQLSSWEQTLLSRAGEAIESVLDFRAFADRDPVLLEKAYSYCEQITAQHSRSFHIASALLPIKKRRATRALYAFCRVTDDIVDDPSGDVQVGLSQWRRKTEQGLFTPDDLVPLAWTDARFNYDIPPRYMTQLIDGVARDLAQTRYATFADLAEYAYGVASTVGLMSMHITGFSDEEAALPYAIKLGVALQLTNILRDVGQDWHMGRIYLPQDELAAFGIDEDRIAGGVVDSRWQSFMRFQIDRTRRLYSEAWPGIEMLHNDGRFAIAAAADLYRAILQNIEQANYDVFNRRAFVSKFGKLRRLPLLWWQSR